MNRRQSIATLLSGIGLSSARRLMAGTQSPVAAAELTQSISSDIKTLTWPLASYRLLPSQQQFHDLPTRYKAIHGPIASGRTTAVVHEALRLALINPPGNLGYLVSPTIGMSGDLMHELAQVLSINECRFSLISGNRIDIHIGDKVQSRIWFKAGAVAERLRGPNISWFGVDNIDYCEYDPWYTLKSRLRNIQATELCGFCSWHGVYGKESPTAVIPEIQDFLNGADQHSHVTSTTDNPYLAADFYPFLHRNGYPI